MVFFNYNHSSKIENSDIQLSRANIFTEFKFNESKNFNHKEINFNLEIFEGFDARKQFIVFDDGQYSTNSPYDIFSYEIYINGNTRYKFERGKRIVLDLEKLLKEKENLKKISLIFKDRNDEELGSFNVEYLDETNNNLHIRSGFKTDEFKIKYSSSIQVKGTNLYILDRFLRSRYIWSEINSKNETKKVLELSFKFDPLPDGLNRLFENIFFAPVIKEPRLYIPEIYNDKEPIKLNSKYEKIGEDYYVYLDIFDILLTNDERGEIVKSIKDKAKQTLRIPNKCNEQVELNITFKLYNNFISIYYKKLGIGRSFRANSSLPNIKINDKPLKREYRYKIDSSDLIRILSLNSSEFKIGDFYIGRKEDENY
ncbi:hypothetical protein [Mycoplasmopsis cynos]|uniref:hypothetical protein n=1 Tax=Mycoplasmopsis cynos TaxID=171284 RepID=UPI002AFDE294|nr:hypothetical protein [Mycoplasmopsis cynos]WQQ17851.1 hypothetical protein RRG56_00865 [Mycoplasmopsis cynos]